MEAIKLGSLFDGIGAFPYAASFFGVETLWASEILPHAVSVTRRHFPDMQHVGDITKLDGATLTPVDIIAFGSPWVSLTAGLPTVMTERESATAAVILCWANPSRRPVWPTSFMAFWNNTKRRQSPKWK